MNITKGDLFSAVTPLILALHENGVLDISEVAHQYEDALARRKLVHKEAPSEVALLEEMTLGLHRLAALVKGGNPPQ